MSMSSIKHKKSLEKLKQKDPEFYEFLQKEDQELLNFSASGSEEEGDVEGSDSDGEENQEKGELSLDSENDSEEEKFHKLPEKLEVASDSEDEEDADEDISNRQRAEDDRLLVTMKMVNKWTQQMKDQYSLAAMHEIVGAFKAAVRGAHGEEEEVTGKYRVKGSAVFNAIVRACITQLPLVFTKTLGLSRPKDPSKAPLPSSSPKWKKVRSDVKVYTTEMLLLLGSMGESSIITILLKHLYQILPYYNCFPKLSRSLLKKLLVHWSTGEETVRVLAFLCINRLTRANQEWMLESCLKLMYMAYVKNCKFTSPTTLPMINFMQRSLVEMFAIDPSVSYQYAFIYIRQLAIHLRNAITVKKKDTCQAVYNWQFIHSLHLWARLLSQLCPNETLQPLVYPLTQVILGTIRLVATQRYYPLRFHCLKILNLLSEFTHTYIPVLPFIMEVFELTDFNKKHKNISFRPLNFTFMLKLSKTQLEEKGFRDGLIEQLCEQLLDHLQIHAHTIGFPELVLPAMVQMKKFLKECKVANYTRQVKQIVDKVEETSQVISLRRKSGSFSLADSAAVDAWEERSRQESTPLNKYYATWRKLKDREIQHEEAGKERISTDKLPTIDRPRVSKKASEEDRKEFSALFDSGSEGEDDDDEQRFLLKDEWPKRKKQKKGADEEDSDSSQYSDFNEEELAILAQSGSEGESEDDEEEGEEEGEDEEDGEMEEEAAVNKTSKQKVSEEESNSPDINQQEDIVEELVLSSDQYSDDDDDN